MIILLVVVILIRGITTTTRRMKPTDGESYCMRYSHLPYNFKRWAWEWGRRHQNLAKRDEKGGNIIYKIGSSGWGFSSLRRDVCNVSALFSALKLTLSLN